MSESTQQESLRTGPFAGLVVIELGNSVAAPFAGQILGEPGARVIKIENPTVTMLVAGVPHSGRAPHLFSGPESQ